MMWTIIILCGVITFITRFIPLSGIMPNELSPLIKKTLKYIPVVVLTPMIINSLSIYDGTELFLLENTDFQHLENPKILKNVRFAKNK